MIYCSNQLKNILEKDYIDLKKEFEKLLRKFLIKKIKMTKKVKIIN